MTGTLGDHICDGRESRHGRELFGRADPGAEGRTCPAVYACRLSQRTRMKEYLEDGHGHLSRSNARGIRSMQNEASEDIGYAKENSRYRPSWLPRVGK